MNYKTKTKKFVARAVGLALVLSMGFGIGTASAASLTTEQVSAIISLLQSFGADQSTISNVQATLTGGTPTGGGSTPSGACSFTRDLSMGVRGDDVTCLQVYLNAGGHLSVSATGYFGSLTKAAVMKWQSANGVSPASGYFGSISKAKYSSLVAVVTPPVVTPPGTTPPPVAPGTGLAVSSPTQPANGLAPQGTARVAFTKVTLTAGNDGDVIVSSFVVERTGLAADAALAGVILLDEDGTQIGISKTFNSNHQAVVGEAFTVKKGMSRTITVAGNLAADNSTRAGQVVSLTVNAVNTSAAVSGSLPITGAAHTINASLSVGSVTNERGPLDPNSAQTKNVGATGYTFSSVKITAGSVEDVRLHSIRWNQASSAGSSDLANIKTVVAGVEYPTTLSADGKFYTSVFPNGLLIEKGFSKEASVKGDIIGGSGRTVAFNVEKTTDVYITGELYKYGITPPTSGTGFTSGTIWYAGKTVTIDTGSITGEKATSVAAQNVAVNLSNQPLRGFTVDIKGE